MSDSASPNPGGVEHREDDADSHMDPTPDLSMNGDQSDADLFGDGDDGEDQPARSVYQLPPQSYYLTRLSRHRKLGDSDLDSGDDLDRNDRVAATIEEDEEAPVEHKTQSILLSEIVRICPPEADDVCAASGNGVSDILTPTSSTS